MCTKTRKKNNKHFSKNRIVGSYYCPDIHIFTLQFSTTEPPWVLLNCCRLLSLHNASFFGEERGELYPAWVTNLLHPQHYCASTNCIVAWQPFCAKVLPDQRPGWGYGGKVCHPCCLLFVALLSGEDLSAENGWCDGRSDEACCAIFFQAKPCVSEGDTKTVYKGTTFFFVKTQNNWLVKDLLLLVSLVRNLFWDAPEPASIQHDGLEKSQRVNHLSMKRT